MNGIPHHRAPAFTSLFGLSSVMVIFDDQSVNNWNQQRCLTHVSNQPAAKLAAAIGPDFGPVRFRIYFLHADRVPIQPYDLMELKSLED